MSEAKYVPGSEVTRVNADGSITHSRVLWVNWSRLEREVRELELTDVFSAARIAYGTPINCQVSFSDCYQAALKSGFPQTTSCEPMTAHQEQADREYHAIKWLLRTTKTHL